MTVALVGAGCGIPEWLTLRGKQLLEHAEDVVYDRLIHPDLLQIAPMEAVFHPVGKREKDHVLDQDSINRLLIRLGQSGRRVVRLKGGDPFIFGRGSEEALALEDAGISWEYVPGISAALGGLGAAGIPLTHRGTAQAAVLATGHFQKERSSAPFWEHQEDGLDTLALYMAASAFGTTAEKLLQGGWNPQTPGSAVCWGGWGRSRRIDGTLISLAQGCRTGSISSPSILVFGETSRLLHAPKPPLAGLQVAVVRPGPASWHTARQIDRWGGDGYSLPLLTPIPLDPPEASRRLALARYVVLSSPRGAEHLRRLAGDLRRISGDLIALGHGTAQALQEMGLEPSYVAPVPSSEGMGRLLRRLVRTGDRVVFVRNERGSPLPLQVVRECDGVVDLLEAYRMLPETLPGEDLFREMWSEVPLDAVVFGSAALVEAWQKRFGHWPGSWVPVAWGDVCGQRITEVLHREPRIMPSPDMEGLFSVLYDLIERHPVDDREGEN